MHILGKTTTLVVTTDFSSNNIMESTYSILSSLHIGVVKYRIYSIKTETATNITIHKMTDIIESNAIWDINYYEGEMPLLVHSKCAVIVVDPSSPIQYNPHSTIFFFCETNFIFLLYKIEAATHHYL